MFESPSIEGKSVYNIKESGVHYRHGTKDEPTPGSGKEFLERFRSNFEIRVIEHVNRNELVFEMINIDVSFANALRRIMISEIPTVAIENVYMWNNSSIIHDEVLAHRLGLVPIDVDPRYLVQFEGEDDEPTEFNTLVFAMKVSCNKNKEKSSSTGTNNNNSSSNNNKEQSVVAGMDDNLESDPSVVNPAERSAEKAAVDFALNKQQQQQLNNNNESLSVPVEIPGRANTKHVYSKDLVWMPQGFQEEILPRPVRPLHEDILLAKIRGGQLIELEAHARIGVGKDHAKYSPVANASYRLMPHIQLVKPVYDTMADELNAYEPGVFQIIPCDDENSHYQKAIVHNPYACTMSRNYMRHEYLKEAVQMSRLPNHFIFNIESIGMLPAAVILAESLRVLQTKCDNLISLLEEYEESKGL